MTSNTALQLFYKSHPIFLPSQGLKEWKQERYAQGGNPFYQNLEIAGPAGSGQNFSLEFRNKPFYFLGDKVQKGRCVQKLFPQWENWGFEEIWA